MRRSTGTGVLALFAWAGAGCSHVAGDSPDADAPGDPTARPHVGTDAATDTPGRVAPTWSAPATIDQVTAGQARGGLALDMSAAGNAVAVWQHSNGARGVFTIDAVLFDQTTKTWGSPEPLTTDDVGSASGADLDVDDAGNAVVVWRQPSANLDSIWSNWFDAGAGTWHGAALVEIDDTGAAGEPCVAALPGGDAVAVWHQWDGLRESLWGNRLGGTPIPWRGRSLLETTDSADALEPDVAADPHGNAVAVWTQDDGASVTIWSARLAAGAGAWEAPRMLSGTGVDDGRITPAPRVALDASGDGLAIWSLRTDAVWRIWASRYHGDTATWDYAVHVDADDGGNATDASLAFAANGDAFATWRQREGRLSGIWAARFAVREGAWTAAVRLDARDGVASFPAVAAGGDRHAVVVWQQRAGLFEARASRFDPQSGTWGAPSLLDVPSPSAGTPRVAVDAAGMAIAIWTQPQGGAVDLRAAYHPF